ncbi:alpha/beta fold hydrolase [Bacterioplanoides sp.]|uniref:alpha/beta fold hydrolase n=1 Tax=Bacterioplanoides sp. TaxID=2066072 RepID=UPI003B00F95A
MTIRTITTTDQQSFSAHTWQHPQPKALIHIVHGMAEHCLRYRPFAEYLQQQGFNVVTHNHRGHGERMPQGHFADSRSNPGGWECVIDDMLQVQQQLADLSQNGQLPVILFGHSMGSFIAQGFAVRYSQRLSGLILSGSNYQSPMLYYAGRTLARMLKVLQNERTQSKVMDALSFGSFNNQFKPARTDFDWLSRDEQQVSDYINDKACGHRCSLQLWIDLFGGLIEISNHRNLEKIQASLPILLIAGDQDPVGQQGKGVTALQQALMQTGHKNVSCTLYTGARHEVLNEINADAVYQDILNWLQTTLM